MHKLTHGWLVAGLLAVAPAVFAQQTPATPAAPARQAPPPADLEPGVNTSAMPANTEPPGPAPAPSSAPASKSAAGNNSSGSAAAGTPAAAGAAPKDGKASTTSRSAKSSATAAAKSGVAANSGAKGGKAEDRLQLDTTQITGNQELPKVLYIVPWKRSDLGDMLGRPANSLLDEVLQPVDRDVFRRQNRYYDALKPDAAGAADKAAGAAVQPSGDKR
jgi:hypothetical protein